MKVSFCIVLLYAVCVKTEKVNDASAPSPISSPSPPTTTTASPPTTPTHQEPPQQKTQEVCHKLVMREVPGSNASQQQTISLQCFLDPPPGPHENFWPRRIWWTRHEEHDRDGVEIADEGEVEVDAKMEDLIANNTSQGHNINLNLEEDKVRYSIQSDFGKVSSLLRIFNAKDFHKARYACTISYKCAEFRTSCQVNDFLHTEGSVQCSTQFKVRALNNRGQPSYRGFVVVKVPGEKNDDEETINEPSESYSTLVIMINVVLWLIMIVCCIKFYLRFIHRPKLIPIRDPNQRRRGVYWREQRPSSMMLEMVDSACNAGQEPEEQYHEEPEVQFPVDPELQFPGELAEARPNVWLYVESDTIQLRANQTGAVDVSAMSCPSNSDNIPRAFIRSSERGFVRYSRSRNSPESNVSSSNRPDHLPENPQAQDNRANLLPEDSHYPTDIPDLLTESVEARNNTGPQLLVRLSANTARPVSISEINDMEPEELDEFFSPSAHWEQIPCNQAFSYRLPSYTDALADSQNAQLRNENDTEAEHLLAEQGGLHQNNASAQPPSYEASTHRGHPQSALLPEHSYSRPPSYYITSGDEEDLDDDSEDSNSGQRDAQARLGSARRVRSPILGRRAGSEGAGENWPGGRPGWLIGIPPPLYDDGNGN